MTISTNDQKVDKIKFEAGFLKAFGNGKRVVGGSFTQGPDGKLVPRGTIPRTRVNAPTVLREIEEFKSPIDGSIISSRGQLAAHNKKHGVTNASDYSEGYIEKKATERVNSGNKFLKETRHKEVTTMVDTILK
jgi:hypothetical protein